MVFLKFNFIALTILLMTYLFATFYFAHIKAYIISIKIQILINKKNHTGNCLKHFYSKFEIFLLKKNQSFCCYYCNKKYSIYLSHIYIITHLHYYYLQLSILTT